MALNKLTFGVDECHFQKGNDYLDVVTNLEGYIELKIDNSDSFAIETEQEIDRICDTLKELLRECKKAAKRSRPKKTK